MLPGYVRPYTDEELAAIVENRIEENQRAADNLEITRGIFRMWSYAFSNSLPSLVKELQKSVESSALFEWGPDSTVIFDHVVKRVLIENFDGRSIYFAL